MNRLKIVWHMLVERAVAGEEIIFDNNGISVAKLVPLKQDNKKPRPWWTVEGKSKDCPRFRSAA